MQCRSSFEMRSKITISIYLTYDFFRSISRKEFYCCGRIDRSSKISCSKIESINIVATDLTCVCHYNCTKSRSIYCVWESYVTCIAWDIRSDIAFFIIRHSCDDTIPMPCYWLCLKLYSTTITIINLFYVIKSIGRSHISSTICIYWISWEKIVAIFVLWIHEIIPRPSHRRY